MNRGAPGGEPAWAGDVLGFWFEAPQEQWWQKDPTFDDLVRMRFLVLHEALRTGAVEAFPSPRGALAAVIALDQFGRHLFRDDPRAYAADPLARRIAVAAIDAGWDKGLSKWERMFLYMPLQHSEDLADQRRAVSLTRALADAELDRFAESHCRIIARFGRFPHRNAVLGRVSSVEEEAWLREPTGRF